MPPEQTPGRNWNSSLSITLIVLALAFVIRKYQQTIAKKDYPPGPKPRIFVGNAFDLPIDKGWETYARWSKEYNSDIVHATALGEHIIVLNSRQSAIELLEKRGSIYSSRPVIPMFELIGWHEFISALPYGPLWRRHKRVFQQSFRREASIQYQPIQTRKIHDALNTLLRDPDGFAEHLKTLSGAIILSVIYDYDVSHKDDHFVDLMERALAIGVTAALPGSHLVNTFPFLRHLPTWFPGAGFHRIAAHSRELVKEIRREPYEMVRKDMAEGNLSSVLASLLATNDAQGGSKDEEEVISSALTVAYAAGSDTTMSTLLWFILAMALNPDAQRKAQAEIDRLTDGKRLPTFDDRASLPYIEALYRELLRWQPAVPLGVPHKTIEDDYYNGYFIPKGSIVISNIWAMNRDEAEYPEPERFIPERFLDNTGNLTDDDRVLAYGFGKRICSGRYFASASVWLFIACFLATFDTAKPKDEEGNEVEIVIETSGGLSSHPLPFKCSIIPHSEEAKRLIEQRY
ncbi:cytochrome P450 [Pluteus cervinus]|uniref:Cytochrome P450 n=1 Tax=Pluteus cervinus TaxID=181527 RepID=A0ACD3B8R9_9AGAR|nr:cytochrome P450 [Pluteus cervinus]